VTRPGAHLRARREFLRLSRKQLATLAGVHHRTVENVERGWTGGAPSTLEALSRALLVAPHSCQVRGCERAVVHADARWCEEHAP
jgi:transcriptional regulator with XRE-family HTH domain